MSYPQRPQQSMSHSTHGMSAEEAQRVRYMAHMERRARPPTFRPLTIVVVVLSLGLFVIGLVMIVIAHWPGVSGGDSMKIAGGVLLSIGGTIFIIAMVVTCVMKNREKERFEKSIASLQASRSNISVISRRTVSQTTTAPSYDAKPGKSILKKTPSTSTYGTNRGSVFGEDDSSVGNHYNNSFGQNHSYEQGSTNSDTSAGKYEVYRIETLPDPSQARRGKNGSLPQGSLNLSGSGIMGSGAMTGGLLHSSTDSENQAVPTPVRNTKKRRGQSPSVASGGRQNPSYSPDAAEMAEPKRERPAEGSMGGRTMQDYSNDGYDMYEGDRKTGAVQPPTERYQAETRSSPAPQPVSVYDGDTTGGSTVPQPVRKKRTDSESKRRQRRAQQQADTSGSEAAYSGAGAIGGAGAYDSSFQNQAFNPQEADLGYPGVQQTITTTTTKHVSQSARPVHDTSRLNTSTASGDDPLRINIKAQPGTSVHITPTGTRAQRVKRTVPTPSQSSVETEI